MAAVTIEAIELLAQWPKGAFDVERGDSLLRLGDSLASAAPRTRSDLGELGDRMRDVAEGLAADESAADDKLSKAVRAVLKLLAEAGGREPKRASVARVSTALAAWLRGAKRDLGLSERRILVIDDDPIAQKAIGMALRRAGFSTIECLRGSTALERLQRVRPALIVLDVEMPDIRGPQLLRMIRRDARLAGIPVIFVSARKQLDVKLDALRSGADDYITKPFKPEELATRVAARLERGAVLQEIALKDPLTGVATHRFFLEKLEDELARQARYHTPFSVACVDIDDLARLNKEGGFDAGDRAVVRVGQFFRRGLRRSDVVARLAGGEFGILLPQTGIEGARTILDRLRERLARPKRGHAPIGLSGGIAGCPETTADRRMLLAAAREALELAKRRGKGRMLTANAPESGQPGNESVVIAAPSTPAAVSVLEGLSTAEVRTLAEVFVRDFSEHLKRLDGLDPSIALRDRTRAVGRVGHFLSGAGALGGHDSLSGLGEAIENAADQLLAAGAPPAGTQIALAEIHDRLQKIGAGLRAGTFEAADAENLEQRLRVSLGRTSRDPRTGEDTSRADILVVDDEKVSQAAIGASLRRAGLSVREAYSGAEALEAVAAKEPDLIILDVVLPDMDGHEVLTRIRANPKLQLVPVIYVSAKKLLDDKILALRTGADDYVTKPFSPEELVARIGSRLERARVTRDLALRDGLTGLYNHRFFQERLENEMGRLKRTHDPFCLALFDIDDFKSINDRHGHQTGDEVLRSLAGRLVTTLRSADVVARYGGEEFAVILPETGLVAAREIMERLRAQVVLGSVKSPSGDTVCVTVSGGLAEAGAETKEQLFRRVDEALYKSKRAGKNRITLSDAGSA